MASISNGERGCERGGGRSLPARDPWQDSAATVETEGGAFAAIPLPGRGTLEPRNLRRRGCAAPPFTASLENGCSPSLAQFGSGLCVWQTRTVGSCSTSRGSSAAENRGEPASPSRPTRNGAGAHEARSLASVGAAIRCSTATGSRVGVRRSILELVSAPVSSRSVGRGTPAGR
jgi:hypothetical protein